MTAVTARARRSPRRLMTVLLFVLPFAWELLGAISNLLAWLDLAALAHEGLTAFAWGVLLAGIGVPVAAYIVALLVARGRGAASTARILLIAFCASEAVTLSVLAFFEAGTGAS